MSERVARIHVSAAALELGAIEGSAFLRAVAEVLEGRGSPLRPA